ncbi:MAG: hypothetical protein P8Z79_23355 [Sedimentisphaerales bacterium]|jgi:hypothetical protein
MARNRGKKALYEVMSKTRQKPGPGGAPEPMPAKKPVEAGPESRPVTAVETSKSTIQWPRRPRFVQYNAGRIEFSVPYQVAIAVALALILLIVASYRLGQFSYVPAEEQPPGPSGLMRQMDEQATTEQAAVDVVPPPVTPPATTSAEDAPPPAQRLETEAKANVETNVSMGDNVIVLVQYHTPADLGPVQAHFAEHGIATEIRQRNGVCFLQTVDRYDNPDKPGTDGYKAKQRIIEVGKTYKAPKGYESFATHLFSDAYGMKVE